MSFLFFFFFYQRRRNVIHIYGCDHLKHADLKDYFGGFEIVGVRWIDGSSCNVQLKDEMTAKNALFKRCSEAAQDQAREKGLEQFGLNWLEALPYKKKKSDDYGAKGTKGSMFVRLATVQDVTHKGTDRPLVQSSTLAGQALAVQANDGGGGDGGGGGGGDSTGGVDKQALARAGAASWNQLMSSHSQNKKNRRTKKKRRAKGGQGAAANRGEEDAAMRDAEYDRYAH